MRKPACALLTVLAACALGCSFEPPPPVYAPPPPGIAATPRWLTFNCVVPGCDTTLVAAVAVLGERDVAIKRVVLSDKDRGDFVVDASRKPPFILKPRETFEVTVKYQPTGDPRLGDIEVLVTYTDASASEMADRIKAGELTIPLVRRLIGEPQLSVTPDHLVFGAVLPSARRTLPLTIENKGFGNVGLVVESVSSDVPEVTVANLPGNAILPGQSWPIEVTFAPIDEAYTEGVLTVRSAERDAAPALVGLLGTSIARAAIALTPEGGVDFGEVAVTRTATAGVEIANRGAENLLIRRIALTGTVAAASSAGLSLSFPRGTNTSTIPPLGSIHGTITST